MVNLVKTIAIRADFDAFTNSRGYGLTFCFKNEGVMHACGHDAHTAYMLILGETLIEIKDQFKGKVIIIHQPAEEMPPGGAQGMIKDGVLDGVDHVLGAHVMSTMEAGKVFYREGFVQTGRAYFKLKYKVQVVMDLHHIWQTMRSLQVLNLLRKYKRLYQDV